jgi:tryptophan synthase alpha chain
MSRIDAKFRELRDAGQKAFIAYITAGDPSVELTGELVLALEQAGTDVIELGIPFSDPLADGPVNQAAAERALKHGVSLADIVRFVGELRKRTAVPIIFFTYFNPIFKYGVEKFAQDAASAGVDGALAVDLPPEESADYKAAMDAAGLSTVYLIAPTSTRDRIRLISEQSTGFVYYVSRTGVTGVRESVEESVKPMVAEIRSFTDKPVAVGFGISKPQQVKEVAQYADGVVVGSGIVRLVGELGDSPNMVSDVAGLVRRLAEVTKTRA